MQIAVFNIPVVNHRQVLEECNSFMNSVRVLTVNRQFVAEGSNSFWSILVEYLEPGGSEASPRKKRSLDYKEILSPEDFTVFNRLRKLRKELAERDGIPVYTVFTNEQLAEIATRRIMTPTQMLTIEGVGKNRVEKYASILGAVESGEPHAAPGQPA